LYHITEKTFKGKGKWLEQKREAAIGDETEKQNRRKVSKGWLYRR